jgi:hypothetical protein
MRATYNCNAWFNLNSVTDLLESSFTQWLIRTNRRQSCHGENLHNYDGFTLDNVQVLEIAGRCTIAQILGKEMEAPDFLAGVGATT